MQLFIDLDGVLADFVTGHERAFGTRSSITADNVDWSAVAAYPNFFLDLPPTADMRTLWTHVELHRPIVLTGVPSSVAAAADNKRAWVRKHLGERVEVRCCASKDKCLHASPGDILVDDWEKHRHLWLAKGGRWITHRSAEATIAELRRLGVH